MAPTEFKYFPLLPQEIQDEIWGHVVHNAQQRLLNDVGKAHFFTFYHQYWELDKWEGYERIGRPVTEAEKLRVLDDDDDPGSWHDFFFAAPRPDPWSQGSWAGAKALMRDVEWMACRDSLEVALRLVKDLVKEQDEDEDESGGNYSADVLDSGDGVDSNDDVYGDNIVWRDDDVYGDKIVWRVDGLGYGDGLESDDDSGGIPEWDWVDPDTLPEEGRRIQTIAKFKVDGNTHLLPISAHRDLIIFRPLYYFQMPDDLPPLAQFDSLNVGVEFDPAFGYPADNPLRFGVVEYDAYGPEEDPAGGHNGMLRSPLEWISILCARSHPNYNFPRHWRAHPERKVWFLDYRIVLARNALIDEKHPYTPRRVFRDALYYYVEVNERDGDWGCRMSHDGVDVHRFAEQLQRILDRLEGVEAPTAMEDSIIGVLARVPIGHVEIIAGDEAVGATQDVTQPTAFKGRVVKRPFSPVEETASRDEGLEEAMKTLQISNWTQHLDGTIGHEHEIDRY